MKRKGTSSDAKQTFKDLRFLKMSERNKVYHLTIMRKMIRPEKNEQRMQR